MGGNIKPVAVDLSAAATAQLSHFMLNFLHSYEILYTVEIHKTHWKSTLDHFVYADDHVHNGSMYLWAKEKLRNNKQTFTPTMSVASRFHYNANKIMLTTVNMQL